MRKQARRFASLDQRGVPANLITRPMKVIEVRGNLNAARVEPWPLANAIARVNGGSLVARRRA